VTPASASWYGLFEPSLKTSATLHPDAFIEGRRPHQHHLSRRFSGGVAMGLVAG
jgi:hypothetical protein